jgi:hypothetical protein
MYKDRSGKKWALMDVKSERSAYDNEQSLYELWEISSEWEEWLEYK